MPTLNWIGKEAVVKHHKDVPFRLLEPVPELSCLDAKTGDDSGNLIVQGDNLHALKALLQRKDFTLARINLQKFLIRNRLEARIRELRKQAVAKTYQQVLFGDDAAARIAVDDTYAFNFHPHAYAPSRDYDPRTSVYGSFEFRKHFYGRIGDFDSKEEFECACWLDMQAQKGLIQYWVRNLVRREGSSFFLQKTDGRFYPDFLCQLPGTEEKPGVILAVEYKGADRWAAAEDDRLIGGLWASLSEDRCRFVMIKEKRWDLIAAIIAH